MAQNQQIPEEPQEIPVYLFTGFLEAGKTQFVQGTLEDKRFDSGERTLLLVCEEGELEYDLSRVRRGSQTRIFTVENEEDLTAELLYAWSREFQPERVVVEYNGMWMLDTLYRAMPQGWMVYQEFCFADARSILSYNANMRQLVYDKLKSCDLVVFNRFQRGEDIMPYHKLVRAANRGCSIAYEDTRGRVKYDEIEDPLPFDKEAPVIEIADRDYALWYRDMGEELKSYDGKTVRFKCQTATAPELEAGTLVVGRRMMNCCAADISFAGMIAVGNPREDIGDGDWVDLTASIRVRRHPGYGARPGPVLTVKEIGLAQPPAEEVATFY
ncbi:MAG: GTPase [Oscillospiraceae bacterium]|nr:GTPase [Oscillospiraceae bacterium]